MDLKKILEEWTVLDYTDEAESDDISDIEQISWRMSQNPEALRRKENLRLLLLAEQNERKCREAFAAQRPLWQRLIPGFG